MQIKHLFCLKNSQVFVALILTVLLSILAYQDFKERSISILLIPLLFFAGIWRGLLSVSASIIVVQCFFNFGFVILQCLLASFYISIKHKKWINITKDYIGWGDILFFVAITPLFDIVNYIFFYTGSLILVLLGYICLQQFDYSKPSVQIPLAGAMAILLIAFLVIADYFSLNTYDSRWIYQIINSL